MIPNFSVDVAIQRHVKQLAQQGINGWESGGSKIAALNKRKEYVTPVFLLFDLLKPWYRSWKTDWAHKVAAEAKAMSLIEG
jgi:hypothetical protein